MSTLDLIVEHLRETLPKGYIVDQSVSYPPRTIVINHTTRIIQLFINATDNIITIWGHHAHIDLSDPNSLQELTSTIIIMVEWLLDSA